MSATAVGAVADTRQLLEAWQAGDPQAGDRLLERVYAELAQMASTFLRRERSDHTLETSALVHEAYLQLLGQQKVRWQSRAHFKAVASVALKRVLLNHARDRVAQKRGGSGVALSLTDLDVPDPGRPGDLLALEEALCRLAREQPMAARIVEMRFFAGMTGDEIAEALQLSVPTVTRRWRLARLWLYRDLTQFAAG